MPFIRSDLTRVSTAMARAASGSKRQMAGLWFYQTADTHTDVTAANYFNAAADELMPGDIILAAVAMGGTPQLRAYIVTSVSTSGVVSVAQITTT